MYRVWGGEEIETTVRGGAALAVVLVIVLAGVILATVPLPVLSADPDLSERTPQPAIAAGAVAPAPAAQRPPDSAAAAVTVSAVVEGVRLIVVGADGRIATIYSNTGDAANGTPPGYTLRARSLTARGDTISPIPPEILAQYEELAPSVDWSVRGMVYPTHHN